MLRITTLRLPVTLLIIAIILQIASMTCAARSAEIVALSNQSESNSSPVERGESVDLSQRLQLVFGVTGMTLAGSGLILWHIANKMKAKGWNGFPTVLFVVYVFMLFVRV